MCAFKLGETVLVYWGDSLYEAKILDIEANKVFGGLTYFVHWLRWPARWDMWMDEDALIRDSSENRQLMNQANAEAKKNLGDWKRQGLNKRSDRIKTEKHSCAKKETKKGKEESESGEEESQENQEQTMDSHSLSTQRSLFDALRVEIPEALSQLLLMDYEMSEEEHRSLMLPRRPNVNEILCKFTNWIDQNHHDAKLNAVVFAEGMHKYFDQVLGMRLLLDSEQEQYAGVAQVGKYAPSELYGVEHLLRLVSTEVDCFGLISL
jgi:hypothetical protein